MAKSYQVSYLAVIKHFTIFLRFVDAKYHIGVESVSKGLGMALNGIVIMLYVVDILHVEHIGELGWGIGNSVTM